MLSGLPVMIGRFEICKRCGPMKMRKRWGTHLEITCEKELLNGYGDVRNVPKSTPEPVGERGVIDVENASEYWLM